MSATLEEFLLAAEYIMTEGNYQVILCKRGVRTFGNHARFTPDLSIIPLAQYLMKPVKKSGKRPGYAPLPARGLGESPHCFSMRILPRLHAGSDVYPGLRHTVLIAMGYYLHSLQFSAVQLK